MARFKKGVIPWNKGLSGYKDPTTSYLYKTHKNIYKTWIAMKSRTSNENDPSYHNYGGRGIRFQLSWQLFQNFLDDMKESHDKGLSLERIDNNGDYTKENCRWATRAEQNRNQRTNVRFNGEIAVDASKRLGGSRTLVFNRLRNGWQIEKAFTTTVIR